MDTYRICILILMLTHTDYILEHGLTSTKTWAGRPHVGHPLEASGNVVARVWLRLFMYSFLLRIIITKEIIIITTTE